MFFKKKDTNNENSYLVKIGSLLIHMAKIDQNYSGAEEEIIKKTLIELGANKEELTSIVNEAIVNEEKSNQILDFTREIKSLAEPEKIKIIKALWKIIYSDKNADIYESNLMRRLAGLLYIDSKIMGNIKNEIKKDNL